MECHNPEPTFHMKSVRPSKAHKDTLLGLIKYCNANGITLLQGESHIEVHEEGELIATAFCI